MPHCLNEYIEINGCKQFISIRSTSNKNPILLYVHGGPGDAALPLVSKYNAFLANYFTMVIWEQRGTGLSYYPFQTDEDISISLFIDDLYAITNYILQKYKQEKLYLLAHSWGSVLGLKFCQLYPQVVQAYIGCGQVVNMQTSSRIAYEYVLQKAIQNKDGKIVKKLQTIDCTYTSSTWLKDVLYVTGLVVKYKGSLYGHQSYAPFIKDVICSKEYSWIDILHRQKGSLQSIQRLWQELMTINFEGFTEFQVPVTFIEGRYDMHVSSVLAKAYYDTITTTKKFYWFEHSCHFPQWTESEKFTQVMCSFLNKD